MIEYLIFDDEEKCFSSIFKVKEEYGRLLLDFPVKFKDINTDKMKYVFVVMEEYKEFLGDQQEDLLVSLPDELEPVE